MKNVLVLRVVVLVVLAVVVSGCNLFMSPDSEETGDLVLSFRTGTGSIGALSNGAEDGFEELTPELTVSRYEVEGSGPGDGDQFGPVEVDLSENGPTTVTQTGLAPGDWEIRVTAYGAIKGEEGDNHEIGEGVRTVQVRAGLRQSATVLVQPFLGEGELGDLDLTLSWPDGFIEAPEIEAWLEGPRHADQEGTIVLDWSEDDEPAGEGLVSWSTEQTGISAGYYKFFIELQETATDNGDGENNDGEDESGVVWAREYTVRIISGRTTTGSAVLGESELSEGELEVVIEEDMQNPFEVSLRDPNGNGSDPPSELTTGEELSVRAEIEGDSDGAGYEWYLSGEAIDDADPGSDTLTHGPLDEGSYRLTVFVTKANGAMSSASFNFSVVPE